MVDFYLSEKYEALAPSDKVTYAREVMRSTGARVIPVTDERRGKLLGLVYRVNLLSTTSTRSNLLVRDVMVEPLLVLDKDEDVLKAIERMLELDEWYAPVVGENGRFLGMFGLEGVLRYFYLSKREFLEGAKSADAMSREGVVYVEPDDSVSRLWYLMLKHKYAGIPVVREDKVIGIVTQHDLILHGIGRPELESESNPRKTKVREIMKTPVYTVKPQSPLVEALGYIVEKNIGRVIAVDEKDRPVGVIDREDLVRFFLSKHRFKW